MTNDSESDSEDHYAGILEDVAEPKLSNSGRKVTPLLDKIAQRCRDTVTLDIRYRCKGSLGGKTCAFSLATPRSRLRFLKHACHCRYLSPGLKAQANVLFLQARMNLAVVNLVCMACLPPTVVDYPEWKNMHSIANIRYTPISSTTLVDNHIPAQAARAREQVLTHLRTQTDLTVSYDGATIKKPQSVYTVSFTTPDGRSFLMEGNEASSESHTGAHISRVVLGAMSILGNHYF